MLYHILKLASESLTCCVISGNLDIVFGPGHFFVELPINRCRFSSDIMLMNLWNIIRLFDQMCVFICSKNMWNQKLSGNMMP